MDPDDVEDNEDWMEDSIQPHNILKEPMTPYLAQTITNHMVLRPQYLSLSLITKVAKCFDIVQFLIFVDSIQWY